jgi:hypothetical protein
MTREQAIRQSVIYAINRHHGEWSVKDIAQSLLDLYEREQAGLGNGWTMNYMMQSITGKFKELSHDIQG